MNKIRNERMLTFLKLFSFSFIGMLIFRPIVIIVLNELLMHEPLDISKLKDIVPALSFSLIWSLFSTHRYVKTVKKIELNNSERDHMVLKIKDVLYEMHWTIESQMDEQIIFKSSIIRTIWRETIIVQVDTEIINLIGSKYYIEELVKKISV